MSKFDDRLLADLMREHGDALASARRVPPRNTKPVWIAAGAVALAGAVTVSLTFFDGGSPAAFAVDQNADGSISVSIKDIAAIEPANKELERLGVPVRAVPVTPGCPQPVAVGMGAGGGDQPGGKVPEISPSGQPQPDVMIDPRPHGGVTIPRAALTPGARIALGVYTAPDGSVNSLSFAVLDSGSMPACLPSGPPPGVQPEPTPSN